MNREEQSADTAHGSLSCGCPPSTRWSMLRQHLLYDLVRYDSQKIYVTCVYIYDWYYCTVYRTSTLRMPRPGDPLDVDDAGKTKRSTPS